MENLKGIVGILKDIVVMAAAVVGGLWAWNRFKRERTDEAAIEMELTTKSTPVGNVHLVFFTVHLANKGKTKIEAKTELNKGGWVFDDGPEQLRYPCSLQIRYIDPTRATRQESLDWFEGGPWQDMKVYRGLMEINILLEYQNPKKNERIEFWMEPGETYRLGVPVILPAGAYVAKLTFVAADQEQNWLDGFLSRIGLSKSEDHQPDENFWSQLYGFTVPIEKP